MYYCSFFRLFIYLLGKQIDKIYEEVSLFYIEIVTFFQTILLERVILVFTFPFSVDSTIYFLFYTKKG